MSDQQNTDAAAEILEEETSHADELQVEGAIEEESLGEAEDAEVSPGEEAPKPAVSLDPRYSGLAAELREAMPFNQEVLKLVSLVLARCGVDVPSRNC
ncbi:MAG: hypothetical protein SNJ52_05455, partial [Verrucomicrobiia bacterium]